MKYNDTVYYYITNLQGDVMQIVDANGNPVATYSYDPYGNAITAAGDLASVNPLRYRGYYYDAESGLYYLQSRYYDPEIGRFINVDVYTSTGQGLLGNNMFAYCRNSPVFRIDISGTYDIECGHENPLDDEDLNNDSGQGGGQQFGKGFPSFQALKNFLGSAGEKMHWHHIVEQSQINKSGFPPEQVHNTSNVIAVDVHTHAKITGYYNTTTYEFTNGLSVRNWLSGQSFQAQFDFGIGVLRDFGVIQ